MLPVDGIEAPESISNLLNPVSLYRELVDELKTYGAEEIGEAVSSLSVIRCLKVLSARVLITVTDS